MSDADVWENPDLDATAPAVVGDVEPDPEVPADPAPVVVPVVVPEPVPAPVVDVPAAPAPELETEGQTRAVVAADAANRAARSALQTTAVTSLASALGVAATYLHDGDLSHLDWKAFAMAAMVAGGQPIAAYLHKMLGK